MLLPLRVYYIYIYIAISINEQARSLKSERDDNDMGETKVRMKANSMW